MGRDVTGLRSGNKLNVKPDEETIERVHVAPKISNDRVEAEQASPVDYSLEAADNEDEGVQEKQEEVSSVERTNIDPSAFSVKAKIEAFKNTEKKLSVKASVDGIESAKASESPKKSTPKAQPQQVSTRTFDSGISNDSDVESDDDDTESPVTKKDDLQPSVMEEKIQPHSPSMLRKPMHADTDDRYHREEDDCSCTSLSMRSPKFKPTVPVGPKFVCAERVARRKEFYMKLEEKQKAMEAERLAEEARIKEAEDEALRKLRKSMSYKANPVPSFYREGPPPKAKLKKQPLTRPKSPNLTRTKSYNDAPKFSQDEKRSPVRVPRRSAGSASTTPKNKDGSDTKNGKTLNKYNDTNGTTKVRKHAIVEEETKNNANSVEE